jgi:hypothetical protein
VLETLDVLEYVVECPIEVLLGKVGCVATGKEVAHRTQVQRVAGMEVARADAGWTLGNETISEGVAFGSFLGGVVVGRRWCVGLDQDAAEQKEPEGWGKAGPRR